MNRFYALIVVLVVALGHSGAAIAQNFIAPQTSVGLAVSKNLDIDETEDAVKTAAGQLYGYYLFNRSTSEVRYFKFYDGLVADVVVGTTAPVMVLAVPANSAANVFTDIGLHAFTTAITVACTTGVLDDDTGAPGTNDCVGNIYYK